MQTYSPGACHVALCGTPVVDNSHREGWDSLAGEERENQYVRLVRVDDNRHLKKLFLPRSEVLRQEGGALPANVGQLPRIVRNAE